MTAEGKNPLLEWINPVGGHGDMLILSSVLKAAYDQNPARKFNLIRRAAYTEIFEGHPAVAKVDYYGRGEILSVAYWQSDEFNSGGDVRPFKIIGKTFGLAADIPEKMYLPMENVRDVSSVVQIPWGKPTVAIAPGTTSPRKAMSKKNWDIIVNGLNNAGATVLQFGTLKEEKIIGAYSLRGVTSHKEAILILKRVDLLITVDCFFVHAAHMAGTRTIGLWGPTSPLVYGYPEQTHLLPDKPCPVGKCIYNSVGKERHGYYGSPCPASSGGTCLDNISPDIVLFSAKKILGLIKN